MLRFTLAAPAAALADAVKKALPFVPKRSAHAVLEHLRLTVFADGRASLLATDLEKSACVPVAGARLVDGAGLEKRAVLLPASALRDALKTRDGEAQFTVECPNAALASGEQGPANVTAAFADGAAFHWTTPAESDFPVQPVPDAAGTAVIWRTPCDGLKRALDIASRFRHDGSHRYHTLSGVFLRVVPSAADGASRLDVVGCDSNRLSHLTLPCELESGDGDKLHAVLPGTDALASALPDSPDAVDVVATTRHVFFAAPDGACYAARKLDGDYPEFERVIPAANPDGPKLIVDRAELARGLKAAGRKAEVRLDPADGGNALKVHIFATEADTDKLALAVRSFVVPAFSAKMPDGMVFYARQLADALALDNAPTMTFQMDNRNAPAVVRLDGHLHLLMPLQRPPEKGEPKKTPPADRGAATLAAALALPDRPVQGTAASRPARRPAASKPGAPLTLDAVLAWLAVAPDEARRRIAAALSA